MKNYEQVVAEATRIEYDERTGKLFIVFEVKDELFKSKIKTNWTDDIEYKIIGKSLILDEKGDL